MSNFDEATKKAVWISTTKPISGCCSKDDYAYDANNKKIRYCEYGNRHSPYGWEIDHIKPVADGGTDNLSNLRALYWETNASRGGKMK